MDSESTCSITANSDLCKLIRHASLIVFDEAPNTLKYAFEALDRALRDLLLNDAPFGGIPFLFGGDLRQILPAVINGNRSTIVNSSLKRSYLWSKMKIFSLSANHRIDSDEFAKFVLN